MKINGIDVEKFGAKQLTVNIQPAQDADGVEWIPGAAIPTPKKTTTTFATVEIVLLFRGSDPGRITRQIGDALHLLKATEGADLELRGYRDNFKGWYVSSTIGKFERNKTHRRLTVNMKGYLHGTTIRKTFTGTQSTTIRRAGARPAPVILTVTPETDLTEIEIAGLTEDPITINNLTAGVPVIIDGRDGTAQEAGESKAADVDMWEAPTLTGTDVTVTWSAAAAVTLEYQPIWL